MKTPFINKRRGLLAFLIGCALVAYGQKESKNYSERFVVNKDVTIDLNTNHTDVVLETWDKNEVAVEARIEVEGVTKEEAEEYFKNWGFEALGNTSKVTISTKPGNNWFSGGKGATVFAPEEGQFEFDFEFPDIPDVEPIISEWDEIAPLPPLPFAPFPDISFDYEAYKKDGDRYLEKWKKEFNKNFDKDFKSKLEEWKKEVEAHKEAHKDEAEKHRRIIKIERDKMMKEHEKMADEHKKQIGKARSFTYSANTPGKASLYYFKSGDEDKNVKVKKIITIKLPKGAKLNMNVRHGEVKLAENFKDIQATLSHTRLLATRIDGENTHIEASYSPVSVTYWEQGQLNVNYVKDVTLQNVKNVSLSSTSSDVLIETLAGDASIEGNFGSLKIQNIKDDFKKINLILDNADAVITLPQTAFNFSCNASSSKVQLPQQLQLDVTKKDAYQQAKGYYKQKNSQKNISLTLTFSDVVVQ